MVTALPDSRRDRPAALVPGCTLAGSPQDLTCTLNPVPERTLILLLCVSALALAENPGGVEPCELEEPQAASTSQPPAPAPGQPTYQPITGKERFQWFVNSTVGPASLFGAGILSSAWGTLLNSPEEYGGTWRGFGQRYGMRLTGVSTGNAIEATMGAIWGEDPRYFRATSAKPFKGRVGHIVKYTFVAPYKDGKERLAIARISGNVGNNILSRYWRVPSETDWSSTGSRIALGFLGRMGSNAFNEFWPDVRRLLKR